MTTRPFGRTGERVTPVWNEHEDGSIVAGDWTGLIIHAEDLDRRAGERVRRRAAALGRPFDVAVVRGLAAADLKVGWPLHRLQRFRDEKLLRLVVIEAADALDAEWIAANAPVHGLAIDYRPADMSARYRVFAAAKQAGVALVGRAAAPEDAALQRATAELAATLLAPGLPPSRRCPKTKPRPRGTPMPPGTRSRQSSAARTRPRRIKIGLTAPRD